MCDYTGNHGGPRFTDADVATITATSKSLYISDLVIGAHAYLSGEEAFIRRQSVVCIQPFALFPYDRTPRKMMDRIVTALSDARKPNIGNHQVAALHIVHNILLPIFDTSLQHWIVAHIMPLENRIYVFDSLRDCHFMSYSYECRMSGGAKGFTHSCQWPASRNPPLLCILQTIECYRALAATGCDIDRAEAWLNTPAHPAWQVVESRHASPQWNADCGIMTLMYIHDVCKNGTLPRMESSTIHGGYNAHSERETVHDRLLSWNQRGLEKIDAKYTHYTPCIILEAVMMRHLISDEERCGERPRIVAIVQCSAEIEDAIIDTLYHIIAMAGLPRSTLEVHRMRRGNISDSIWMRATLYIHLFTDAPLPMHANISRLSEYARTTNTKTNVTDVYALTVVAGSLQRGMDRVQHFPHTCYRTATGMIQAPEGREKCSNWYISCLSSYAGGTPWSSAPDDNACNDFIAKRTGTEVPAMSMYPDVFVVERKYMSLGLAFDTYTA